MSPGTREGECVNGWRNFFASNKNSPLLTLTSAPSQVGVAEADAPRWWARRRRRAEAAARVSARTCVYFLQLNTLKNINHFPIALPSQGGAVEGAGSGRATTGGQQRTGDAARTRARTRQGERALRRGGCPVVHGPALGHPPRRLLSSNWRR